MAKNWMAWEAAKALYGDNKEEIAEVASRYPLFARTVCMENSEYLLDILKALPKVTARVVETGLKELEGEPEVEETEEEAQDKNEEKEVNKEKEKAPKGKAKAKQEEEPEEEEAEDEDEKDYGSMTSKELYALCCKRGLSSKCKKRDKASLIAVLKAADGAGEDEESDDDWGDEEETKDPYAGKTAKELYMMCKQRGIKAAPKKDAAEYAKLLKKADEAEQEEDSDDDDWEI